MKNYMIDIERKIPKIEWNVPDIEWKYPPEMNGNLEVNGYFRLMPGTFYLIPGILCLDFTFNFNYITFRLVPGISA